MRIRKQKYVMKTLALFTILVFLISVSYVDSYAQVNIASTGTGVAEPNVVPEPIKQPLPKEGNVTVNFKDVDIKTVLHYLSEVSGVDIIPSPGVDAKVTMRLRDKPWEVALDIVARNYGYVYSREEGIIRVLPKGQLHTEEPITEVIALNNLTREIELTKQDAGDGENVIVEEKEESIQQLMTAINSIIDTGKGERATYISSVNAIVVTAIPARISEIKRQL